MKKMTSQEIRETWLRFFQERSHRIEESASLIPQNDPTLLWINAGVAALKKYFDGSKVPPCKRITNVQKCIRTNDIDNVGRTARHHTFFEMMGNFSIGDYFRNEVIPWAFELLTSPEYFGIDKEKLYVTHHPSDKETRELWIKSGLDESHLIPLEGNFWQIGEGPCGPDTEMFFDRGEKYDPEKLGVKLLQDDIDNERYVEIWNIVFSQFNAINGVPREEYKELPHKNIDTGAGLERFACILQETETNFETDLFYPIILKVKEMTSYPYEGEYLMAYRVIADHIRSCSFALADGEYFSNEGRGYVLRRLLRRAMRYGKKLGFNQPFLYKLVPTVIEIMKDFYPYLLGKEEYLMKMIKSEEEKFIKTLNSGEMILNNMIKDKETLSGEEAFKLYDTYGFPLELTIEICSDSNVRVDEEGFHKLLLKQKEMARNARKNIESFNKQSKDLLDFTDKSEFIYTIDDIKGKVIGLFKDGVKVDVLDDEGDVVFDKTNFYAEMGGQVADSGIIENDETKCQVIDCIQSPNKQHLHCVKIEFGSLKVGDVFDLKLDKERRAKIMKNHSATHLLQSALIKYIGSDVRQKGSFVNDEYLRFDFNHFEKIDSTLLKQIEEEVNLFIEKGIDNNTLILPLEEAKKVGALAEFDGKYEDEVRVVCFGDVSKEFCGGTHVKNTKDIGSFVIVSEESISSGVRRIEARTGINAYHTFRNEEKILDQTRKLIDVKSNVEIEAKLNSLLNEKKELEKEIENLNKAYLKVKTDKIINLIKPREELTEIIYYFDGLKRENLIHLIDEIKTRTDNYKVAFITHDGDKNPIVVGVSKKIATKEMNANVVLKKITAQFGGNGGGRDDMAQGNIISLDKLNLNGDTLLNEEIHLS